jgi:hypothetical protein
MNNNNNLLLPGDTVIIPDSETFLSYADPGIIGAFAASSYPHATG